MEQDLELIYSTINGHLQSQQGQCVLLLGPELSVHSDGVNYKSFFKELIEKEKKTSSGNAKGNLKYFEADNLFYFANDPKHKRSITNEVKGFYDKSGDPVLLEMISRVKFPLIINVCPDLALNRLYKEKGIEYKEGYFAKDTKPMYNSLPYPTREVPVIYNIFGSIGSDQSLIMTHGRLYQTMEYLLPEKSLPDTIELYLNNTSSFIFLGFKFDSWYYQLICHKLKIKDSENSFKTTLSAYGHSPDRMRKSTNIIMRNHFDMLFTPENPLQVMQRIISECEQHCQDALRPPTPNGNFSTYVSYARFNPSEDPQMEYREAVVKGLIEQLKAESEGVVQVFIDREELRYGDSIDSFMTRIGTGKTVIRVISDKYLKSRYCMDEAMRIEDYRDTDKRVFNIVLGDCQLGDEAKSEYSEYWKSKCMDIYHDFEKKIDDTSLDIYKRIYRFVGPFINKLKDDVHLKYPYASGEADRFIKDVVSKMKEN